uniref:Cysteine protease n=1 Tax=Amazona collaria TaxID=241587 RepID=A0A8B9FNQ3_9PSIT
MDSGKADAKAVFILVPVRLGGGRTNMGYLKFVKGILGLEYCVSIVGGKPKQSYYFAGFQDDSLIYMDLHYYQSFVFASIKDFSLELFYCPTPRKMSFKKMDPSCAINFFCRTGRTSGRKSVPLFAFVKGHSKDNDFVSSPIQEELPSLNWTCGYFSHF